VISLSLDDFLESSRGSGSFSERGSLLLSAWDGTGVEALDLEIGVGTGETLTETREAPGSGPFSVVSLRAPSATGVETDRDTGCEYCPLVPASGLVKSVILVGAKSPSIFVLRCLVNRGLFSSCSTREGGRDLTDIASGG
jgi:hypothetical protein